jgi:hypothetical protein
MFQGLGAWFSFSLLVVFFLLLLGTSHCGSLRGSHPLPFVLGGVALFFLVYFDRLFYFFSPNILGGLLGAGSSYIWLAGLVAYGSFGFLGGSRTSVVFYRGCSALFCIFLAGVTLLRSTSLV